MSAFFDKNLWIPKGVQNLKISVQIGAQLEVSNELEWILTHVDSQACRFKISGQTGPRPFLHPSMLHRAEDLCVAFAPDPELETCAD